MKLQGVVYLLFLAQMDWAGNEEGPCIIDGCCCTVMIYTAFITVKKYNEKVGGELSCGYFRV